MKKILVILLMTVSFMFAALNLNTATKDELMAIKGIGEKKAKQIITFRKKHEIKSVDDLSQLKGFGPTLISNIKNEIKVKK